MTALRSTVERVRRTSNRLLDTLLPPRCGSCGVDVHSVGTVCLDCWQALTFIAEPLCAVCGRPFETGSLGGGVCAKCQALPPAFGRARSAILYDAASRKLILGFKHADRVHLAPLFVGWLRAAGGALLESADCLVPVPLHPLRLLARRYNQSAVLARLLGRESGLAVLDRALIRQRNTPSQGRLTGPQRARNVGGAFALANRIFAGGEAVGGRRVLLIDDVLTTGATVSACARALRAGGAAAVDVLTIARVR